jgi:hypothetical protein
MKPIHIICAALLLTGTACNKELLEQTPQTNISDADFWKTSNDLKLYTNNFYALLPAYRGFGTIGIYGLDADEGSDNMIYNGYNTTMNAEGVVPASGGGWAWGNLRNINYFLTNYQKVQDPWDNVKTYVGEAHFFRSWFYFDMLKRFGDLPWINKPLFTDSEELYNERLKRNIVVDSILADLDKAIEYLPTKSKAEANRLTKEAAMIFAARIALYEGSWEKYHAGTPFGVSGQNGDRFFTKAVELTNALMASNVHRLDNVGSPDGYWRLFNQSNYSGSNEIMFWRRFDAVLGIAHNWHRYTNTGAGRGLTKNLVDAYLCKDGLPISTSPLYKGDATLLDVATDRDPRFAQTIYLPDGNHFITISQPGGLPNIPFTVPTFGLANENKPATGYQVYKGHNPEYAQQFNAEQGITAVIYFRYAEALLINAEAKAELGTLSQEDLNQTINLLRQRVGMPILDMASIAVDPNQEFPQLSPLLNEIRRERRIELACEGFRHDDLFRWAAAGQKIKGWKPKGAKKEQWVGQVSASLLNPYPVDDQGYIELFKNVGALSNGYNFNPNRNYLFPIPTGEMVLNPKLVQNPGW